MCNHDLPDTVIDNRTFCDPCIAPLVKALNDGGFSTVASCCGHGHNPTMIGLADDRYLLIVDRAGFERITDQIHERIGCPEGRECEACAQPADRDAGQVLSFIDAALSMAESHPHRQIQFTGSDPITLGEFAAALAARQSDPDATERVEWGVRATGIDLPATDEAAARRWVAMNSHVALVRRTVTTSEWTEVGE